MSIIELLLKQMWTQKYYIIFNQVNSKELELSMDFIKHSDFVTCKSSLIYFCGILGYNLDLQQ